MEDEERVGKSNTVFVQELLAKAKREPRERAFAAHSATSCQKLFMVSIRIKRS